MKAYSIRHIGNNTKNASLIRWMNRMQEKEQLEEISKMIESIKQIIEQNQYIHIPPFGQSKQLNLKSNNYVFFLDLNRKGHKRPKCTF